MKKPLLLLITGLMISLGCADRDPTITIVDIGYNDRIELGKQLRIIKQYAPKIVAFDFYLFADSLNKDSILVKELKTLKNGVQIVGLYDLYEPDDIWDDLKVSHPKFRIANYGF